MQARHRTLKRKQATPPVHIAPPLLTEAEAARFLNTSVWFLRDDRRGRRVVPFVKLGVKAVRYRIRDVEQALDGMVLGVVKRTK
jgi:hypothetical protein